MRLGVLFAILWGMFMSAASATVVCPSTRKHEEWDQQCFHTEAGKRAVKPMYRNKLDLNEFGTTTIMIGHGLELVAVDSQGRVIVSGIEYVGDFDYPNVESGIGRFFAQVGSAAGRPVTKCGYFEAGTFRIVIPAQYEFCQPFQGGEASVCTDCVPYCSDPDCHSTIMVGGQGSVLAPDGSVRRTFAILPLEQRCPSPASLHVEQLGGGRQWTECRNYPRDPFRNLR